MKRFSAFACTSLLWFAQGLTAQTNSCPANAPLDLGAGAAPSESWIGWGGGLANTRFQDQKSAGIAAADVPKLKLKWAFGFPGAKSVYGQPSVVGGRVFVGVDTGTVYSLDAGHGLRILDVPGGLRRAQRCHFSSHRNAIRGLLW